MNFQNFFSRFLDTAETASSYFHLLFSWFWYCMVTNSLKSCSSCSFCWNVWAEDNCHFLYSFVATPSCQNLPTLPVIHRTLLSSLEDQQPCLYILILWAKGISWFPRSFLGTYQLSFFLNNVMESGNGGISTEYGLLLPFFLTLALSLHSFRKNQSNVGACGAKGLSVVNSQRRLNLLISIIQDLPENTINLYEKGKMGF